MPVWITPQVAWLLVLAPLVGCADRNEPSLPIKNAAPPPIAPRESSGATAPRPTSSQPRQDKVGESDGREQETPSTPAASLVDVVRLSLPRAWQAEGYAYDSQTGRLAIIGRRENGLAIASLDGQVASGPLKRVKQVGLLGRPYKVAHKARKNGALFAVSQADPNGVLLVDVESGEVVKGMKLARKLASFLPAAGPPTPYLYVTTSDRQGDSEIFRLPDGSFEMPSSSPIEIHRLNVDTMEFDKQLQIRRLNKQGQIVFGDTTLYYWRDFDTASFHASGRYATLRNTVYDAAFARALTVLKCGAKTFLADGPWVVGVTRDELVVCSINDGRIVTGVPIPSGHQRVADVFFDASRSCLVVGLGRDVVVVPMDKLDLPDEPILLFEEAPPTTAELRKPYEFLLTTVSGNPAVTLAEGPEGMRIEGKILRWRPETGYTGPVDVKLEIASGDVTREESWQVTVE